MTTTHLKFLIQETASVTWIIENFSKCNEPTFSEKFHSSNNKFQLGLFRKATLANFEDDILVYLYIFDSKGKQLSLQCEIKILGNRKLNSYSKEFLWDFKHGIYMQRNLVNLISREYLMNTENRLLIDGKLTIDCKVNVLKDKHSTILNIRNKPDNNTIIEHDITMNYQALLEGGEFSDVVIVVSKKEFHLHKNILAVRSKVFKAMFSADLEEKKKSRVEIIDVDVEVFEQLLNYIYSGKVPDLAEYGLELFVAADKYQLEHLKSICEQSLSSSLTIESVSSVIVTADMHSATELKSNCIQFITTNSTEVMATDGWKAVKSRSDLVLELFENLSLETKAFFKN